MAQESAFTIDESQWPILQVRLQRKMSDPEFAAYLESYGRFLDQPERYGVIFDVDESVGMTPISQARMQMTWMKREESRLVARCWGIAFVLTSALHRGALRAILNMQGMPVRFTVVPRVDDAKAWLIEGQS